MKYLYSLILIILVTIILSKVVESATPMTTAEKNERYCLAMNIYFEGRSEDNRGQQAIGYVTLNRVLSHKYPNSICKVVWQRSQFSWTHDGKPDTIHNTKAWKRATMIADYVLSSYLKDTTGGALFYHAHYVKPYWIKGMKHRKVIGNHVFYTGR